MASKLFWGVYIHFLLLMIFQCVTITHYVYPFLSEWALKL